MPVRASISRSEVLDDRVDQDVARLGGDGVHARRALVAAAGEAVVHRHVGELRLSKLDHEVEPVRRLLADRLGDGVEGFARERDEREFLAQAHPRDLDDARLVALLAINKITQGFHAGDMIVVAARPSVGKTALALNFAYRAANRTNKPVAIFSLEMPAEQLITRLIGTESSVSLSKITTGNLLGVDRAKVANAIYKIGNLPIYIDDSPNGKLMDIIAKSRKLQANNPDLGLIIIDYLGLVSSGSSSRNDSRQEEVRKASLALKALARELEVPVIVVSQLSRSVEQRGENKRPILSDLRDSGSIEQDADVVMLLYREDYYKDSKNPNGSGEKKLKNLTGSERFEMVKEQKERITGESMVGDVSFVEVNIAKNRNGQTGKSYLFFYKSFGRFDEPSEEWLKQMREINQDSVD